MRFSQNVVMISAVREQYQKLEEVSDSEEEVLDSEERVCNCVKHEFVMEEHDCELDGQDL